MLWRTHPTAEPLTVAPDRPAADGAPWWPGARRSLVLWLVTRAMLALFVLVASYLLNFDSLQRARTPALWLLERFVWMDSFHFLRISDRGYIPPGLACCDQAFFPGYPLTVRALAPVVGGNLMVAGIAVAVLAGAVAVIMLWRLAADSTGSPRIAATAVLFLTVAPYGVFFSAAYSESLFLAFGVSSWWAAIHHRWWLAGLLAGAATGVRINGLFLAAALGVMYLVQLRADDRWLPRRDALGLLSPLAVVGAYFTWLHLKTGSWTAWQDSESMGWHRHTAAPWHGLMVGWHATQHTQASDLIVARWADFLTVVGGMTVVVVLLVIRRWPEATYIGLSMAALACSTTLVSSPRYALTLFPGYVLAAQLAATPGWRWLERALIAVCAPALIGLSLAFAAHQWVS